ncbi:MAG TPA: hypothetical protein VMT66_12815 [Steroidobacteraceae bacterium]|nr:hypothetical protein [Steroidobacteraceae bacterium]
MAGVRILIADDHESSNHSGTRIAVTLPVEPGASPAASRSRADGTGPAP